MTNHQWQPIADALATQCARAGFDLIAPLQIGWYNETVEPAYTMPDFGSAASLAFVVGNTRAFWRTFLGAIEPDNVDDQPIDTYAETTITAAVRSLDLPFELRFAPEPPPRRVAMQRLAHVAGLAYQSTSYLSVHAEYGPWIGLRAAVVFDVAAAGLVRPHLESPCDCTANCAPALERALAAGHPDNRWQAWLAVRDACPVGRSHRYSDAQIRYHYTKDRSVLDEAMRPAKSEEAPS